MKVKLNPQQKQWYKEAKLLMLLADQQEKSEDKTTQLEAVHNRKRLCELLLKLHIIRRSGTDCPSRDEQLANQWDAWVAGHATPGASLLGERDRHVSKTQRVLQFLKQNNGFEGEGVKLAELAGVPRTTLHDILRRLEKQGKITVNVGETRKYTVVVV